MDFPTLQAAADFKAFNASDGESFGLVAAAETAPEGGQPKQPTVSGMAYSGGVLNVNWGMPVIVDLAGLRATENIVLLLDHRRDQLVGQGTAKISSRHVRVEGSITGDTATPGGPCHKVVVHAKGGFKWPLSIGVTPEKVEEVAARAKVSVNGRSFTGPCYVVRAGVLRETSFVSIGGDEFSSAKVAASAAGEQPMKTFEQWLTAQGKDINALSDADKTTLQAAYDAMKAAGLLEAKAPEPEKKPAAQPPIEAAAGDDDPVKLQRLQAAAEFKRQAMIVKLCGAKHPDLAARAVEENWDEPRLAAEVKIVELQAARPKGPTIMGGGDSGALDRKSVEAALCMKYSIGVDNAGKSLVASYGQEAVDRGERIRRLRPSVMLSRLYAQAGVALPDDVGSVEWMRAAFSGSDIGSTILGAVANKALAGVLAEPTWKVPMLFGRASHANFHTHTVYSLAVNGDLELVAPTGELEHMDLGKESWTRQLATRGALLGITRQDLINDDLGAFTRAATTLARKAMNTREKAGLTAIMASAAGASHFTDARGNYLTGAGTALGTAGLGNAIKAFRNLTGPDGDPINVEPSIILVPPTLETTARTLLAASSVLIASGVGSSRAVESSANIFGGQFGGAPIVHPYLETSTITGYSAAYWYLFASPAILPCYEIAYLNGQESPTIEFFGLDANADVLGVTWRVYYDFGVGAAEWRAGVKSAGS